MTLRVIYIAGWGRSGSTMLENLLTRESGAAAIGESFQLWSQASQVAKHCSCGELLEACPVWSKIQEEMTDDWSAVVADMVGRRQSVRLRNLHRITKAERSWSGWRDIDQYATTLGRLYAAASSVHGVDTLVDASKLPLVLAVAANVADIELKVVHLVRDPRGVMYSWSKPSKLEYTDGTSAALSTHSPAGSLERWAMNHSLGWYVIRTRRLEHLAVSYERLAAADPNTLVQLTDFTGIDVRDAGTDDIYVPPQHAIGGNPGRANGDRLVLRNDDRWRTGLPAAQRRLGMLGLPLRALLTRPRQSTQAASNGP